MRLAAATKTVLLRLSRNGGGFQTFAVIPNNMGQNFPLLSALQDIKSLGWTICREDFKFTRKFTAPSCAHKELVSAQ